MSTNSCCFLNGRPDQRKLRRCAYNGYEKTSACSDRTVFIRTQARAEMRDIIKCALQAGADVSLICVETPDELGLKPA